MASFATSAFAVLLVVVANAAAPAASGRVVKKEPAMGAMQPGERVLIDDGSCGRGKIKEVIGGNHWKVGGKGNTERQRRCIAR